MARAFSDRHIGTAMLRTIRNATLAVALLAAPAAIAFAAPGSGSAGTLGSAIGTTPSTNRSAGAQPYAAAPTTNPDAQLGGNSPLNANPGTNSNLNGMAAGVPPRVPWGVRLGADG